MERRHDPALSGTAPGLVVAPYSAISPYPVAAILTSWANAAHGARWARDAHLGDIVNLDEPVLPSAAEVSFWPEARIPLGDALKVIPEQWWPARSALPVPGDLGGLPAGATKALSAGQAVVWSHSDNSLVLSPISMPGGDRMWWAERTSTVAAPPPDQRQAARAIMVALEECVALAEAALLPRRMLASTEIARVSELPVPLPPGSAADTVALARQAATLVAIVDAAMASLPETSEAAEVRAALAPLGRAARVGLSVAFSAIGPR